MGIKVIDIVIVGDKCWWWSVEGPLVVNIILMRQGTKVVLVVPVCSKDPIILEHRSTGQNWTAGGDEGGPEVRLSILKLQGWAVMVVMVGTAGTDEAGEREGVERVVLEEGESALDIRADWVGSVRSEGGEVNVSWRIDHYRLGIVLTGILAQEWQRVL